MILLALPAPRFFIHEATVSDLVAIPVVEREAARLFPREDLPARLAEATTAPGALRRACARRRLWVAEVSGSVVGFVLASFKDGMPYVRELGVLPTHGRQGIGTALMATVVAWARRRRAEHLLLTTFRHLPYNAPFYIRLGFEEVQLREQGPELRQQLRTEAQRGIDPARRVAMRLRLHSPP